MQTMTSDRGIPRGTKPSPPGVALAVDKENLPNVEKQIETNVTVRDNLRKQGIL